MATGHLDGDFAIARLGSALASEDYACASADGVRVVDELRMDDVDGDGWSDLLVRDEAQGTLTVWVSQP